MKKLFVAVLFVALFSITPAMAADWQKNGVHVTVVEGTYVPGFTDFQVDVAVSSSCPLGQWLTWKGQGSDIQTQQANVKAVYALLLAAKLSGQTVNVYGLNAGCVVTFIHLQ